MTKKISAMTVLAPASIAAGDYITILDASESDDSKNPKKTLATAVCPAGTTNPASPVAGDRFFRTDLGLEIYYDGTRWLTDQLLCFAVLSEELADGEDYRCPIAYKGYTPYYVSVDAITVSIDNDGSNYFTVTFLGYDISDDSKSTIFSFDTSGDDNATDTKHVTASPSQPNAGDVDYVLVENSDTGSPTTMYILFRIWYRFIIT